MSKPKRQAIESKYAWGPWGPVADPAPPWIYEGSFGRSRPLVSRWGPVADPAPWWLLDKSKIAVIKVRQLDLMIGQMEKELELYKVTRDLLKQEYKIK